MQDEDVGVSKKSVSWTSTFVTMVLQESGRRSDVTFLVQSFWTLPCLQEGRRHAPKASNQYDDRDDQNDHDDDK